MLEEKMMRQVLRLQAESKRVKNRSACKGMFQKRHVKGTRVCFCFFVTDVRTTDSAPFGTPNTAPDIQILVPRQPPLGSGAK